MHKHRQMQVNSDNDNLNLKMNKDSSQSSNQKKLNFRRKSKQSTTSKESFSYKSKQRQRQQASGQKHSYNQPKMSSKQIIRKSKNGQTITANTSKKCVYKSNTNIKLANANDYSVDYHPANKNSNNQTNQQTNVTSFNSSNNSSGLNHRNQHSKSNQSSHSQKKSLKRNNNSNKEYKNNNQGNGNCSNSHTRIHTNNKSKPKVKTSKRNAHQLEKQLESHIPIKKEQIKKSYFQSLYMHMDTNHNNHQIINSLDDQLQLNQELLLNPKSPSSGNRVGNKNKIIKMLQKIEKHHTKIDQNGKFISKPIKVKNLQNVKSSGNITNTTNIQDSVRKSNKEQHQHKQRVIKEGLSGKQTKTSSHHQKSQQHEKNKMDSVLVSNKKPSTSNNNQKVATSARGNFSKKQKTSVLINNNNITTPNRNINVLSASKSEQSLFVFKKPTSNRDHQQPSLPQAENHHLSSNDSNNHYERKNNSNLANQHTIEYGSLKSIKQGCSSANSSANNSSNALFFQKKSSNTTTDIFGMKNNNTYANSDSRKTLTNLNLDTQQLECFLSVQKVKKAMCGNQNTDSCLSQLRQQIIQAIKHAQRKTKDAQRQNYNKNRHIVQESTSILAMDSPVNKNTSYSEGDAMILLKQICDKMIFLQRLKTMQILNKICYLMNISKQAHSTMIEYFDRYIHLQAQNKLHHMYQRFSQLQQSHSNAKKKSFKEQTISLLRKETQNFMMIGLCSLVLSLKMNDGLMARKLAYQINTMDEYIYKIKRLSFSRQNHQNFNGNNSNDQRSSDGLSNNIGSNGNHQLESFLQNFQGQYGGQWLLELFIIKIQEQQQQAKMNSQNDLHYRCCYLKCIEDKISLKNKKHNQHQQHQQQSHNFALDSAEEQHLYFQEQSCTIMLSIEEWEQKLLKLFDFNLLNQNKGYAYWTNILVEMWDGFIRQLIRNKKQQEQQHHRKKADLVNIQTNSSTRLSLSPSNQQKYNMPLSQQSLESPQRSTTIANPHIMAEVSLSKRQQSSKEMIRCVLCQSQQERSIFQDGQFIQSNNNFINTTISATINTNVSANMNGNANSHYCDKCLHNLTQSTNSTSTTNLISPKIFSYSPEFNQSIQIHSNWNNKRNNKNSANYENNEKLHQLRHIDSYTLEQLQFIVVSQRQNKGNNNINANKGKHNNKHQKIHNHYNQYGRSFKSKSRSKSSSNDRKLIKNSLSKHKYNNRNYQKQERFIRIKKSYLKSHKNSTKEQEYHNKRRRNATKITEQPKLSSKSKSKHSTLKVSGKSKQKLASQQNSNNGSKLVIANCKNRNSNSFYKSLEQSPLIINSFKKEEDHQNQNKLKAIQSKKCKYSSSEYDDNLPRTHNNTQSEYYCLQDEEDKLKQQRQKLIIKKNSNNNSLIETRDKSPHKKQEKSTKQSKLFNKYKNVCYLYQIVERMQIENGLQENNNKTQIFNTLKTIYVLMHTAMKQQFSTHSSTKTNIRYSQPQQYANKHKKSTAHLRNQQKQKVIAALNSLFQLFLTIFFSNQISMHQIVAQNNHSDSDRKLKIFQHLKVFSYQNYCQENESYYTQYKDMRNTISFYEENQELYRTLRSQSRTTLCNLMKKNNEEQKLLT